MPRWIKLVLAILMAASLIPLACIARARSVHSSRPRVHLINHMDAQSSYRDQEPNDLFADRRSQRPPVPGTVADGQLAADDHLYRGIAGGDWATTIPIPVTSRLMSRGRQRFDIFCAPCHGLAGGGDGMVARRAEALLEGTWVPPTSLHDATVLARPDGHLFSTITRGIRTMPSYGPQIPVEDRWAIVAYVRALQRSQAARPADVPAEQRPGLK